MTPVVLPSVVGPAVTIVMVTYGSWALCRRALESVVEHTDPVYEVVVVDNASPDGTADRLRHEVVGATLVRNDRNHGFGAAANQGALHAVGRHLCFLNSDAFVTAGWLDPMLEVLDGDSGVAAVAPRFLNLDGSLQEAGYLLDRLAVTYALGSGDDPEQAAYRFRRTLDYGSGACLLVRRADFAAAGGFHPAYARGYYEDVDLGQALAARNLRVVYQPRSTVLHVLGGSSVFDQSTMERVAVNRATFQGRWSEEIAFRPSLEALDRYPHRLAAARDFTSVDRILVVGEPSDRGLAMAEAIARRWPTARVTLLPCPSVPHDRLPALLAAGVEVPDVPGDEDWGSWLDGRRFHYSVVVRGGLPSPCLDAALARSQPQAMVMLDLSGQAGLPAPDALVVAVRTADVVLCASDADRLLVAAAAPGATALVLPQVPGALEGGRGVGDPLVEAMAHVGLAPPPAALERWRPRPERAPSRSR